MHKASSTVSARDPYIGGPHESGFSNATAKTTPALRDQMYVYALLDPCNVPASVLVSWAGPLGRQHAGYWGVDSFSYDSRRVRIGDLPPAGQWVRLSFPAAKTGLENWAINGLVFKVANGRVWYDRPGRFACTPPVAPPPASFPAGDRQRRHVNATIRRRAGCLRHRLIRPASRKRPVTGRSEY